ncbi:MAG: WS/DGAT domain-containing protein [Solirubrobacteraceae bacterium]|nr:WS/DGAT domain-containing protein [Patulibacter sp.]
MTDASAQPSDAALRPSALDQAFLDLERPGYPPLHIGFSVEIDGPAPSTALMRAMIAGAVGATPELTRRLVRDPLNGALRWFDDPWFDAGGHIDAFAVEDLTDRAAIDALITRLFASFLPRDRPLWRFQALSDGERTLMAGQLHHVLADGSRAVELALQLVGGILSDDTPTGSRLPDPTLLEGVKSDLAGMVRGMTDLSVIGDLFGSARPILERIAAPSGPDYRGDRQIARSRVDLDPLRDGVREQGGTVTAALVVACARALRGTGIVDGDRTTAFVPLNARRGTDPLTGEANQVSVIYASLPSTGDPKRGLQQVTKELRESRHSANALSDLGRRADDLPNVIRAPVARAISTQVFAPVIVSSNVGPPEEIELFGRRITGMWGWAPSPAGQPMALSAVSYAGGLHLTLVGDTDGIPDAADTLARIEQELEHFTG